MNSKVIAKLLATENIDVVIGNLKTAYFDVKNRTLGLPDWSAEHPAINNLLIGHEVGHARFTPHTNDEEMKTWKVPFGYVNCTEDNRIERLIQSEYPGLIHHFNSGYKKLLERKFFGDLTDLNNKKLIDRINLRSKLGTAIDIEFTDEELELFNKVNVCKTHEEAIELAREIYAYDKAQHEEEKEEEEQNDSPEDSPEESSDPMTSEPDTGMGEEKPESEGDDDEKGEGSKASSDESEETEEDAEGNGQSGDADDEAEDTSETETSGNGSKAGDTFDDTVETDKAFAENLKELSTEAMENNLTVNEITKEELKSTVVTFSEWITAWEKEGLNFSHRADKHSTTIKKLKKSIQPAVKTFEQNKAAHQWRHATTGKTGRINTNALHSYKISDDIFLRSTKIGDAKSHGMFMMIDLSYSMSQVIKKVIHQTIQNILFCKAVGIPFEVYTFTSGHNDKTRNAQHRTADLCLETLMYVERCSSSLKKSDFEKSLYMMLEVAYSLSSWSGQRTSFDSMGGTPLIEAFIVSAKLMKKFKANNQIEKLTFVPITDGQGHNPNIYTERNASDDIISKAGLLEGGYRRESSDNAQTATFIVNGKKIVTNMTTNVNGLRSRTQEQQENVLREITKSLNAKCVGFFITGSAKQDIKKALLHKRWEKGCTIPASYHGAIQQGLDTAWLKRDEDLELEAKELVKAINKESGIAFGSVLGYDEYYILKIDKTRHEKTLDSTDSKTALRDFKAMNKQKNSNRVIMKSFGKTVAV